MDTSTKLATFSLEEEEVLTEYIPKHVKLCGYNFNILGGLFATA